ncbi:hypothetical protein COW80_05000 [Candidatus Beckwithbacteria bacterium CG22_combo_CG10-13_8_21_14_all_01_47_9]|uniref:Uncharacterized protein n=5 Tax=Candidatus Beckwithiibacteriota TaxID=1752726 RepID=A0A2H0DZH2_9BACT|nr:MAG: hypothetical protein AUJ59_02190 [Candidatus Beckwithbacteria bacterium CG1_02_47_37]PIP87585.1 MAG: hypothetical protein COW80_05000 [Candidatus Beckwithbacteria bacterium CG22_combo_CG10-13_8_21_14_all_01_47_9]PJC66126.1 MAG: hypothetical protein CO018_03615 [Candidatus Beckwithbacteria bacterium CG_4_9_14_0_2_um_filter_47_11]
MILMIILLLVIFLLFPSPVEARKKLPARKAVAANASLPGTGLKLRGDRQALLLTLTNLGKAKSLSYLLTYQAGEVGQGVDGSHDPALGNTQKELVFGTCSGNVCTYHQNLSEMIFRATIGLNDGRTLTRKYQIKI